MEQSSIGNATAQQIAQRLANATSVAIFTHTKPDGDAVGSSLALARALHHAGIKHALPIYEGPWSARFDDLVDLTPTEHISPTLLAAENVTDADAIAIVDTCSWSQLVESGPFLADRTDRCLVIDHHIRANPEIAPLRYIDPTAAAACQMVASVAIHLLNLESPDQLPADVAAPLYVGIGTDTGWFRHSNTTAHVHRLAADLISTGIPRERLYASVEQSGTIARLKLSARALASLRLLNNGRAATMVLRKADFNDANAGYDEGGGLTDLVATTATIRAVALIHEVSEDLTKVSFRSKSGGSTPDIDVNALAKQLGGGGHFHAAGAKLRTNLDHAVEQVTSLLEHATAEH